MRKELTRQCVVCREEIEPGEAFYAMFQGDIHTACLTEYAKWFFENALGEELQWI